MGKKRYFRNKVQVITAERGIIVEPGTLWKLTKSANEELLRLVDDDIFLVLTFENYKGLFNEVLDPLELKLIKH